MISSNLNGFIKWVKHLLSFLKSSFLLSLLLFLPLLLSLFSHFVCLSTYVRVSTLGCVVRVFVSCMFWGRQRSSYWWIRFFLQSIDKLLMVVVLFLFYFWAFFIYILFRFYFPSSFLLLSQPIKCGGIQWQRSILKDIWSLFFSNHNISNYHTSAFFSWPQHLARILVVLRHIFITSWL